MDIALETVCYIISKARELSVDVKEMPDDSGPSADEVMEEMEDADESAYVSSPESDELKDFIDNLNEDEQSELVALAWIGRGTFTADDWGEAVETALDEHTTHTGEYLLGLPLLADYLEEGLSEMGLSCEDLE